MAKTLAILLLLLQLTSFTAFSEELETLTPTYPPHTTPAPLHPPTKSPVHPPTKSPVHPPANAPHHHHHHHIHSPTPAATPSPIHTPLHPPYHSTPVPAKPPTHGHHHHHPHPPAPSPVHTPVAPAHPPLHPPVHTPVVPTHPPLHPPVPTHPPLHPPAPAHPPLHPTPLPRSFIAVQGVVYVKSCKYAGVDTLLGATQILGAVVKLQCNNTKYKLVQKTQTTDKNGYFFIEGPKNITSYAAHKCNIVLVSAPNGLKPSNLHGGLTGAGLRPEKPFVAKGLPFILYTVGPLAFEPKCPR